MSKHKKTVWMWCLHCERCYLSTEYRREKPDRQLINMGFTDDLRMCHYPDCDGSLELDGWPWEKVREAHPEYPEEPILGVLYPLY